MVVKQISSKKASGSFGGLADYLLDKSNESKKVQDFEFKNCPFTSPDENLQYIKDTALLNQNSSSDKTLHLVVSFQEDEFPSKTLIKDITQELLKSIGMEEHQLLVVSHNNTNNFHFHIAINKIHPESHKIIDPYQSKNKLLTKAKELEEKHHLKRDQRAERKLFTKKTKNIKFKKGLEHGREEYTREQRRVARRESNIPKSSHLKTRGTKQTQSFNDMRELSDCDVVSELRGVEVLLQNDAFIELGRRGRRTDNTMRRSGDGDNGINDGDGRGVNDADIDAQYMDYQSEEVPMDMNDADIDAQYMDYQSEEVPMDMSNPDIEIHSGMDNLNTWIKTEVLDDLFKVIKDSSKSFDDFQKILAKSNLEIKPRANGITIAHKTKKLFVKPSAIHRELSKANLEKRFGELEFKSIDIKFEKEFGISKNNLWDDYQTEAKERKASKKVLFAKVKEKNLEEKLEIKDKYKKLITDTKKNIFITKKAKRNIYTNIFERRKEENKNLSLRYKVERDGIFKKTNQISYKEYLIARALEGEKTALKLLRKRKPVLKKDENAILGKSDDKIFITKNKLITKQGLVVYKIGDGNGKIIDKGDRLKITIDNNDDAIKEMLNMAIAKYGKNLDINGDISFKQKVISVNEKYNLNIIFKDKTMEEIKSVIKKEKQSVKMNEHKKDNTQIFGR